MKKTAQHIVLLLLFINSFFTQGQVDVLAKQIHELKEHRNFITESACPQREDVITKYQENFDKLLEVLDIATLVYYTPLEISKERLQKQEDKFFTYSSTNLTNVIVKRYSSKISLAGLVSDNSSIPVGTRLLTETFTFKDKKVEVKYRIRKTEITLINLEAIYTDKTRVYIEFIYPPQGLLNVYNTNEFGSENKNLEVHFSNEIGKLNLIRTTGFEMVPERYTEMITANQGLVKYRYATYCYDEKGNQITPTKKGKELTIQPTNYLLWYKGSIGKHPIHLMLKRGFVKEEGVIEVNDTIISNVRYAYDSQKKWIDLENRWERQAGIFGFEGEQDDTPEWDVELSNNNQYGKELTGTWSNLNGKTLPIKLTPMTKEFPTFVFKAQLENEILPNGNIGNQTITALNIYKNNKKIQQINLSDSKPDLEYFELSYVDINYDGYLDLILDNRFFLYNSTTKKFDVPKDDEGEWDYIPDLKELYNYDIYNKSFIVYHRQSFTEYRALNGKITPFMSEYCYPDTDGNMVCEKQRYINGKWKTIEKTVDSMNDDEEEIATNDDIDIGSPVNYKLNIDLTVRDGSLNFSPNFYNNTGLKLEFKQMSKLYVELTDAANKTKEQYLYDVQLSGDKEYMIDDNYIIKYNGIYFLENWNGLIPFFPPNTSNGNYTYQLVLKNPLFGKVKSKKQQILLPFNLNEDASIQHFKGTIGKNVKGSFYFTVDDNKVIGTFINAKTGKNISLKGTYIGGFFGVDTMNLEEYEKEGKLSGYFEGKINTIKGEDEGVYKGFWISPNQEMRVPFEFKKQ